MKRLIPTATAQLALLLALGLTFAGCRPASRSEQSPIGGGHPAGSVTTDAPTATVAEAVEPGQAAAWPTVPIVSDAASPASAAGAPVPGVRGTVPAPPSTQLVPVAIGLPAPAFRGTPVPGSEPFVEEPSGRPRAAFLAPKGTENLALGKLVTCSDPHPSAGEVDFVTDGAKDASDFGCLELGPGTQWVQIDLGWMATIYAIVVWHNHAEARVYRDVVVQVSDDPDFLEAVTVFNNDYDNSSGLGIGTAMGYVETSEGRLIDCRGVDGRYVRLYSRGNHMDDKNHYIEVDVYGVNAESGDG